MATLVCGIDPGLKGGLVAMENFNVATWFRLPIIEENGKRMVNARAFYRQMQVVEKLGRVAGVLLEEISARPNERRQSSVTIGVNYGLLLGVLGSMGFTARRVAAQTWQAAFSIDGSLGAAEKLCESFWPGQLLAWRGKRGAPMDGVMDAALIARYAVQRHVFTG